MIKEFKDAIAVMGYEELLTRLGKKGGVGTMRDYGKQIAQEWRLDNGLSCLKQINGKTVEFWKHDGSEVIK